MLSDLSTHLMKQQEVEYDRTVERLKAEAAQKEVVISIDDPMHILQAHERDLCKVCCEQEINTVIIPCGHQAICHSCSQKYIMQVCFVCNQPTAQIFKTYKA